MCELPRLCYNVVKLLRVRLSKRRAKKGTTGNRSTFLAVKHREMEPDELANQVGSCK